MARRFESPTSSKASFALKRFNPDESLRNYCLSGHTTLSYALRHILDREFASFVRIVHTGELSRPTTPPLHYNTKTPPPAQYGRIIISTAAHFPAHRSLRPIVPQLATGQWRWWMYLSEELIACQVQHFTWRLETALPQSTAPDFATIEASRLHSDNGCTLPASPGATSFSKWQLSLELIVLGDVRIGATCQLNFCAAYLFIARLKYPTRYTMTQATMAFETLQTSVSAELLRCVLIRHPS